MREMSREELRSLIVKSSEDLHRTIDAHYGRLCSMLDGAEGESVPVSCPPPAARSREERIREAFIDAIGVLEETRKAFKSKQLQALRQRMTQVLTEAE